jgi:streptogramin lyase
MIDVRVLRLIVVLAMLVVGGSARAAGGLPGAHAIRICAAAGPYWPTMTLAFSGESAWIACKEQSRVIRVDTSTRKTTKSLRLGTPVIAIASGFGSVWALDSGSELYRINPASGKVVKRLDLRAAAAYNIWIGGGSVWVADDQGAKVVRVSPVTNRVVARIAVGDGPAGMTFSGASAWVIDHRDTTIHRIGLATNESTLLTRLGGDAPERIVWSHSSLWITGRGTDLIEVRPADGRVLRTIEIGASGIDLAAAGDDLWVPARSAEVDQRGFPTMDALRRVSPSTGQVLTVVRPTARLDVHGLIANDGGVVWIADNRRGYLYRFPKE